MFLYVFTGKQDKNILYFLGFDTTQIEEKEKMD